MAERRSVIRSSTINRNRKLSEDSSAPPTSSHDSGRPSTTLDERDRDLAAARAANRELLIGLNAKRTL